MYEIDGTLFCIYNVYNIFLNDHAHLLNNNSMINDYWKKKISENIRVFTKISVDISVLSISSEKSKKWLKF